jgi:hypothetical protein
MGSCGREAQASVRGVLLHLALSPQTRLQCRTGASIRERNGGGSGAPLRRSDASAPSPRPLRYAYFGVVMESV